VLQAPRGHRSVGSGFGAAVALGGNFALVGAPGSVFTTGILRGKKKVLPHHPSLARPAAPFRTGVLIEKKSYYHHTTPRGRARERLYDRCCLQKKEFFLRQPHPPLLLLLLLVYMRPPIALVGAPLERISATPVVKTLFTTGIAYILVVKSVFTYRRCLYSLPLLFSPLLS
jgi:hypothetical protein